MSVAATAFSPTASASRYLQQLCKHWAHNLQVEFTPDQGRVVFPAVGKAGSFAGEAVLTLTARADGLESRIEASEPAQLERLKKALEDHLDRFAFREAPMAYGWV